MSKNGRGMSNDISKLEAISNLVVENNVGTFLVQEAWLFVTDVKVTNGYTIFYHGLEKKLSSTGERGAVMM